MPNFNWKEFNNVASINQLGVKYICVGSAILEAVSPAQAYSDFLEVIGE